MKAGARDVRAASKAEAGWEIHGQGQTLPGESQEAFPEAGQAALTRTLEGGSRAELRGCILRTALDTCDPP